tara:strand:- start:1357 stop:1779 length:423 start_codon:yes stop_codon:yes gene_type:complete
MKKIFYIISLSIVSIGCSYTGNDTIINGTEINIVLLEVPSEPDTISEDMRYANFELEVPEITEEIYDNASINAYIKRTYEDDTPDRWSQLPQVFLNSDSSTSAYLSFGEGFIRISFQSEESVEELYDLFAGRTLKLVIVN